MSKKKTHVNGDVWKIDDSRELYGIGDWGNGYFDINKDGNLVVIPDKNGRKAEILEIIEYLKKKNIKTPVLLRFPQLIESRINELYECFGRSIKEAEYSGIYKGVFPLKVNQRKEVIAEIVRSGERYNYGLEAGTKAELMECLNFNISKDSMLICNGYKDKNYITLALCASLIRKNTIIVIDNLSEVNDIIKLAKKMGISPNLGIRLRLYSRGSGKWAESGGESSKFGLTTSEMLEVVDIISRNDMIGNLKMLHFHIGSQITEIRRIQNAVKEASRLYAKVKKMAPSLRYFNVGGGLGVDYDGSKTSTDASANYSIQEYTNHVVFTLKEICDEEEIEAPTIVTESGRAVSVYHSMLVMNLAYEKSLMYDTDVNVSDEEPAIIQKFQECYNGITVKNYREYYHDSLQYKEELINMFNLGQLELKEKAKGEALFHMICHKIIKFTKQTADDSEEFDYVKKLISKKYIGNFSVFQSMPDFWAIDHLFPIVPIQRLNEQPDSSGTILDMTCDSDGEIDKFADVKDVKELLELHSLGKKPYYVAVLLLGAYQDAIGDMHNLFGTVNEVHIVVDEEGRWDIKKIIKGDRICSVLALQNLNKADIMNNIKYIISEMSVKNAAEKDARMNAISRIRSMFSDYTYPDFL